MVSVTEKAKSHYTWFEPDYDGYYCADIRNDGSEMLIRKFHAVIQTKYYDDYNLFQIYESEKELIKHSDFQDDFMADDYAGLHSKGNIYEIFPIVGRINQFWTCRWEGITYCLALSNNGFVYTLQVYKLEQSVAKPVYYSIFLDEAQNMKVSFK